MNIGDLNAPRAGVYPECFGERVIQIGDDAKCTTAAIFFHVGKKDRQDFAFADIGKGFGCAEDGKVMDQHARIDKTGFCLDSNFHVSMNLIGGDQMEILNEHVLMARLHFNHFFKFTRESRSVDVKTKRRSWGDDILRIVAAHDLNILRDQFFMEFQFRGNRRSSSRGSGIGGRGFWQFGLRRFG